ncbi:MAG: hypothetical protein ACYSUV_12070, partial [Planctomycetota bacterium]
FTIEGDCRAALAMTVFVAYSVERIADRGAGGFGIYDFRFTIVEDCGGWMKCPRPQAGQKDGR